ncbi:MAG: translation initiation factor [Verrucomicrobiota bacterium]
MARSSKKHIVTAGSDTQLNFNAFASLSDENLPEGPKGAPSRDIKINRKGPRHVVNMRRLTAGKGGKVVTELTGFEPDFFANRARIALKDLQKQSGGGGTVKGKAIELQGDCRERVKSYLEAKGYRVVLAGG